MYKTFYLLKDKKTSRFQQRYVFESNIVYEYFKEYYTVNNHVVSHWEEILPDEVKTKYKMC